MNLDVSPDRDSAIDRLCELIVAAAPRSLVLTGGTTAGAAYEQLASVAWRERVDWPQVTLYFGDERRVPPDDERSNYGLAHEHLLRRLRVRPREIHRIRGELPPGVAADEYDHALTGVALDFVLLGLGSDGHMASLFPGSQELIERAEHIPSALTPEPYRISNSHSRKGGATLFLTTFTRVLLPTACSPFFTTPVLRMSRRTLA